MSAELGFKATARSKAASASAASPSIAEPFAQNRVRVGVHGVELDRTAGSLQALAIQGLRARC